MSGSLARRERIGVIAVLLIALLLTAVLFLLRRPAISETASPEETAIAMDSLSGDSETIYYKEKNKKRKNKSRKKGKPRNKTGNGTKRNKKAESPSFRDMEEDTLFYAD